MFNRLIDQEYVSNMEEKDIQKETLKPITKANSNLDKQLREWKVESTIGGGDLTTKRVRIVLFKGENL